MNHQRTTTQIFQLQTEVNDIYQLTDEEQLRVQRISAAIKRGVTPPYEDALEMHKRALEMASADRDYWPAVDSHGQPVPVDGCLPPSYMLDPDLTVFRMARPLECVTIVAAIQTPWRDGAAHPHEIRLRWMKLVYWNHPQLESVWTFQFSAANDPPTQALNIVDEGIKLEAQMIHGGHWSPVQPKDMPICPGGTSIRISYPRRRRDASSPVECETLTFPYPAGGERRILPG
ncbi:hypothetical protein D9758_011623 [Tetrapyrgos nigripes]|uniref:Uncharacterized protein n=1 Tax=Tetrapyrgos nigripes TaxID=182062 RepID=A0A8H5FSE6_9AGAR|nr:hypothetical protein D9758_011623 [Tetrapyrgos nigripes]